MNISNIITILEARRNFAINKQEDSITYLLRKYAEDPDLKDLFITFSSVNKVGINPSTKYNTPNGFYCYPLDYILKHKSIKGRPFPPPEYGNSNYLIITKLRNKSNVYDVTDNISAELLQRILQNPTTNKLNLNTSDTIRTLWRGIYKNILNIEEYQEEIDNFKKQSVSDIARKCCSILRSLGIDGVTDLTGTGTIHEYEPYQAVFINVKVLQTIDVLYSEIQILPGRILYGKINRCKTMDDIAHVEKLFDEYKEYCELKRKQRSKEDYSVVQLYWDLNKLKRVLFEKKKEIEAIHERQKYR